MRATIQQVLWSWKIAVGVALLAAISAYADTPPTWAALGSFAGGGNDAGYAVKVDKSGNRYVTGFFSSTATFDGQLSSPKATPTSSSPKSPRTSLSCGWCKSGAPDKTRAWILALIFRATSI